MEALTTEPKKRGKKPGSPRTGGRVKGTLNHATAEVKTLARRHGPEIIAMLAKLALDDKKTDAVRVAAAKELLDRGYGKSVQPISGPDEGPIQMQHEHSIAQELTDDQLADIVARSRR